LVEIHCPLGIGDDQTDVMNGLNQRHGIPAEWSRLERSPILQRPHLPVIAAG
jgi:hypothetical protein